jgi:hypothetical protein
MTAEHRPEENVVDLDWNILTRAELIESCQGLVAENERLREALKIIAEGTLCPELFPELDVEKDVWELQAKTAGVSAIAALEQ